MNSVPDQRQVTLGRLLAHDAGHQAQHGVGQHLEQVPHARTSAGGTRPASPEPPTARGVAERAHAQEHQHHQRAQDVRQLEVGRLEHLPCPGAPQRVCRLPAARRSRG